MAAGGLTTSPEASCLNDWFASSSCHGADDPAGPPCGGELILTSVPVVLQVAISYRSSFFTVKLHVVVSFLFELYPCVGILDRPSIGIPPSVDA